MKHSLIVFTVCALLFGGVLPLYAQPAPAITTNPSPPPIVTNNNSTPAKPIPKLSNPIYANSFEELLFAVVDIAIFIGVTIAVFIFIFIGFKFVMAQGDPKALSEAKQWFLYAVIGTALLIGSKLIVEVIKNTVTGAGLVKQELFNKK